MDLPLNMAEGQNAASPVSGHFLHFIKLAAGRGGKWKAPTGDRRGRERGKFSGREGAGSGWPLPP